MSFSKKNAFASPPILDCLDDKFRLRFFSPLLLSLASNESNIHLQRLHIKHKSITRKAYKKTYLYKTISSN